MANDLIAPTKERQARGDVEALTHTIADDAGRPSRPYRSQDILEAMERRGTINPQMRLAANDFRSQFRKAFRGDLRASDLSKPFISGTGYIGYEIGSIGARIAVSQVLFAVGGEFSQAGSILWHVIGLEWTIKQWAQMYSAARLRKISEETASGILVGALCPLVTIYGYEKK